MDKPVVGYLFYAIAIISVTAAVWPFFRDRSILHGLVQGDLRSEESRDLVLLLLLLSCFVAYLVAEVRVASYFFGGCFFLSILTARLVARCWEASESMTRIFAMAIMAAAIMGGTTAAIEIGSRNEIETLTLGRDGKFYLARFPAKNIEDVQSYLRVHRIESVWTTISFIYPLIFESEEKLAASGAIFGWNRRVYPEEVLRRKPLPEEHQVFVLETFSPFRPAVERECSQRGGSAIINEFGTLTIIEEP